MYADLVQYNGEMNDRWGSKQVLSERVNVVGGRCFPTGNKHPLSLEHWMMMLCLINEPVRCLCTVVPRRHWGRTPMPPQISPATHCKFSWINTQASPFRMFMASSRNLNCMLESWFHSLPSSFLFSFIPTSSHFLFLTLQLFGGIFPLFLSCSI